MGQLSWTQGCCDSCWDERYPDRKASRLRQPGLEICCYCGSETRSGIYVRVDPLKVPHPTREKEAN